MNQGQVFKKVIFLIQLIYLLIFLNDQGYLINKNKIIEVLNKYNFNYKKIIISTCGSGVTACVLAFALEFIGKKSWKVYDGSWSEWGQKGNKLIEV